MSLGCLGVVAVILFSASGMFAEPPSSTQYPEGVFVTPQGGEPAKIVTYIEANAVARFGIAPGKAVGSLDEAPIVDEVAGALVSIPSFQIRSVFLATAEIFSNSYAERRQLPIKTEQLNVYATHVRIADLERRDRIDSLLRSVRASATNPGYVFIAVESHGQLRYYPFRLTTP
jgi:hypothetical protein